MTTKKNAPKNFIDGNMAYLLGIDETPNEDLSEIQTEKPFANRVQTEPSKPAQQSSEPETIIAKRNSQKQRKASLEEYKNKFLQPPKITDRKTVYLSSDTRDRLDEIVRRLGERGASVSGFIENMAKEHLENFQDEIELWKNYNLPTSNASQASLPSKHKIKYVAVLSN